MPEFIVPGRSVDHLLDALEDAFAWDDDRANARRTLVERLKLWGLTVEGPGEDPAG